MKIIIKIIIVVIVAFFTGKSLTGCVSQKDHIAKEKIDSIIVLPEQTKKLILRNINYNVIQKEENSYICINSEKYVDQVYNLNEIRRYIEQLKKENNTLREVIKNN